MEGIRVQLNNPEEYEKAVHGGLQDLGDLRLITKDRATMKGHAGAVLAFTVMHEGKKLQIQTTTTVGLLMMALAALRGRYTDDGLVREHLG